MLFLVVAYVLAAILFIALRAFGIKKIGFVDLTVFFLGLTTTAVLLGIYIWGFYKVFLERFDLETIIIGTLGAAIVVGFIAFTLSKQSKTEEDKEMENVRGTISRYHFRNTAS